MPTVHSSELLELQSNPKNIRNICVLAHVDHGKTTLSDSLIASNGIISQKMAGKIRYLDSRPDEQLRGITMKSSAISLLHEMQGERYLVNLIDSPGHVDFSSEVSTAVRISDGALILVDVVEGISPQTHAVIKQAWAERLQPVLILNKLDRLILELKLSPQEAYIQCQNILEQANAIMALLFRADLMEHAATTRRTSGCRLSTGDIVIEDWCLEDKDDSDVYFDPCRGNVVFTSAIDGFGFGIDDFSAMYATRLGVQAEQLLSFLWGDFYFVPKQKKFVGGALASGKKPLFVQFILENIWAVYDAVVVRQDLDRTEKIVSALELQVPAREMKHKDPKMRLNSILHRWLPLSKKILDIVCTNLPSPVQMDTGRCERLLYASKSKTLYSEETLDIEKGILSCSSDDALENATVVLVSKMVAVEKDAFPQNRSQPPTLQDIETRREIVRQKRQQREAAMGESMVGSKPDPLVREEEGLSNACKEENAASTTFVGFARVFCGTLRPNQRLFVLPAKYDPTVASFHTAANDLPSVLVEKLFLWMGRSLEEVESVPAGNIVGILGLKNIVYKSATLSTSLYCPSLGKMLIPPQPIVRVAVEPEIPSEMPHLVKGLKILNQADPCVNVLLQETGEHVIVAAGEVHLERCIKDLVENFAKIAIKVSDPIVSFKETIVEEAEFPAVHAAKSMILGPTPGCTIQKNTGYLEIVTSGKRCKIIVDAKAMPATLIEFLCKSEPLLKRIVNCDSMDSLNTDTKLAFLEFEKDFKNLSESCGKRFENIWERIWSFGPKRRGPNVLVNEAEDVHIFNFCNLFSDNKSSVPSAVSSKYTVMEMDCIKGIEVGFQLATQAGPLCEEPMMGVCFFIKQVVFEDDDGNRGDNNSSFSAISGQIISASREGFRYLLLAHPVRLMMAMYACDVQVNSDFLGKLYTVISKRKGDVVSEDMKEGTDVFIVKATIPVVESFGFVEEIRKKTSGLAIPQLFFTHWQVLNIDPFWVPTTEEEVEHFGEKADSQNSAFVYMNQVRRRKGLRTFEKIVEHAEKQRTLKRNK